MRQSLANKNILLGITGSIAAYKSADLVRRLREAGATVRVAMTENAKRFITPLTMQAVSGFPVHDDLFDPQAEAAMGHIELARWADAVLIAPATADFMARLATGIADDLLTTICLATQSPIIIAPAMNQGMWKHMLTKKNLQALEAQGVLYLQPSEGSQACGDVGPGRMMEPVDIIKQLEKVFANGKLAGIKVLITAGPTQEAIDPIRFISNHSSGKMGYALAAAAKEAGAIVTLISGPTAIPKPADIALIDVISAQEMYDAVMNNVAENDIFIAVSAVSDYRCEAVAPQKLHKTNDTMQLNLVRNPDIVSSVGLLKNKPFIVGFAAETENLVAQAKNKLQQKKMDLIIANVVGSGIGMGSEDNEVTVIGATTQREFPRIQKSKLARELINLIADVFKNQQRHNVVEE